MASYFCLSDGTVIHAVAGPVDARQFLREPYWPLLAARDLNQNIEWPPQYDRARQK